MSDDFEDRLLAEWAKHRAEGARCGIDHRHDWQNAPQWAHDEAEAWQRQDSAWRLLIGVRLANRAIERYETNDDRP